MVSCAAVSMMHSLVVCGQLIMCMRIDLQRAYNADCASCFSAILGRVRACSAVV